MKFFNNYILLLIGGILSIAIGIPFAFRFFGPSEAEVVSWGFIAIYAGTFNAFLTLVYLMNNFKYTRYLLILGFIFTGLIQIPPIYAWFFYHGAGLTDKIILPGDFTVHWIYSLPHILMLIISHKIVIKLLNINSKSSQVTTSNS